MSNQTQNRLDTLTPIHKALRRLLFETAIQLARTDFGSTEESAAAEEALSRCFGFLREQASRRTVEAIASKHTLGRVDKLFAAGDTG